MSDSSLSKAEAIGRAIESERAAVGLTQEELAAAVGDVISPRTLAKVLRGTRMPSLEELDAIAEPLLLDDALDLLHRANEIAGRVARRAGTTQTVDGDGNLAVGGNIENSTVVIGDTEEVTGSNPVSPTALDA